MVSCLSLLFFLPISVAWSRVESNASDLHRSSLAEPRTSLLLRWISFVADSHRPPRISRFRQVAADGPRERRRKGARVPTDVPRTTREYDASALVYEDRKDLLDDEVSLKARDVNRSSVKARRSLTEFLDFCFVYNCEDTLSNSTR